METNCSQIYETIASYLADFSFPGKVESQQIYSALPEMLEVICGLSSSVPFPTIQLKIKDIAKKCLAWQSGNLSKKNEARKAFEAAFIILYAATLNVPGLQVFHYNTEQFLRCYPQFGNLKYQNDGLDELEKLRVYRNYMTVAARIINPKSNKDHLMDIVTKICEGSTASYVRGGKQTPATTRREQIFIRESGKTPTRKRKVDRANDDACHLENFNASTSVQPPLTATGDIPLTVELSLQSSSTVIEALQMLLSFDFSFVQRSQSVLQPEFDVSDEELDLILGEVELNEQFEKEELRKQIQEGLVQTSHS